MGQAWFYPNGPEEELEYCWSTGLSLAFPASKGISREMDEGLGGNTGATVLVVVVQSMEGQSIFTKLTEVTALLNESTFGKFIMKGSCYIYF